VTTFRLPRKTGVYVMKGDGGRILYVGKALDLKSRVNQYLRLQDSREMVPRLVREIRDIEWIVTANEKEALLVERQLIRKLHPKYNVMLRDDRSFLLVRVDDAAAFPRFELVRRRKPDRARYFGPYPPAHTLREFLRLLARAYKLRTCADRQIRQRQRPCALHAMGWCSAPCVFPEKNGDYGERLESALGLLSRRKADAEELVRNAMWQASDSERYEEAARYRDLLQALGDLWGRQHVEAPLPLDADILAVHHGPLGGGIFLLHVRESAVAGSTSFFHEGLFSPEVTDLESLVCQYYERRPPPSVVIGAFQADRIRQVALLMWEEQGRRVEFRNPRRGPARALLDMARENAVQTYLRESRKAESRDALLQELAGAFGLPGVPERVECIDISSFQSGDAVGSVSVARDGLLAPDEYRCFHVRSDVDDDLSMMEEVVSRRLQQVSDSPLRRLVVLDGGRAHLARMLPLFAAAADRCHPAALAKARPDQGLEHDRIYLPGCREPLDVAPDSRIMLFLQSLRDEAHRFGVAFHRKKRKKRVLSSPLLEVPGVGPKRRLLLIRHFGSYRAVVAAPLDKLLEVPGLPASLARRIHQHFSASDKGAENGNAG